MCVIACAHLYHSCHSTVTTTAPAPAPPFPAPAPLCSLSMARFEFDSSAAAHVSGAMPGGAEGSAVPGRRGRGGA